MNDWLFLNDVRGDNLKGNGYFPVTPEARAHAERLERKGLLISTLEQQRPDFPPNMAYWCT